MRKETWKNADYPNAIPVWNKRGFSARQGIGSKTLAFIEKREKYEKILKDSLYNPISLKRFYRIYTLYEKYCILLKEEPDKRFTKIIEQQRR